MCGSKKLRFLCQKLIQNEILNQFLTPDIVYGKEVKRVLVKGKTS
jgi:hypothetical protein